MKAAKLELITTVIAGKRHENYKHVTEYASKLKAIATAEKETVRELLEQFIKRETEEEFEQRIRLTRLFTRALWHRIKVPFNKALRKDNAKIDIGKAETEFDGQFYQKTGVYKYLSEIVHPYLFCDPNGFLMLKIAPYDHNVEKAKLYPEIITSEDAVYFEYDQSRLMSLCVRNSKVEFEMFFRGLENQVQTKESNSVAGAGSFEGNTLLAQKIDEKAFSGMGNEYKGKETDFAAIVGEESELRDDNKPVYMIISGHTWKITESVTSIDDIQAHRIGYEMDLYTDMATVVSPVHPAVPRIESTIKSKSELDLSIALHVFPQKIQQYEECRGWIDPETKTPHYCKDGVLADMNDITCPNCDGSGMEPVSKSAADVIKIKIGAHADEDHDLDNIVRYIKPDIDTPKFLDEFLTKHENLCLQDIFPGNTFSVKSTMKTATEVQVDYESQHDGLVPYVRNFEKLFTWVITLGMKLRDEPDPKVSIMFPDDFEIKSLAELIEDYRNSNDLPVSVRKALRRRIARKLSSGSKTEENKEAIRIIHEPFADKSESDIRYIISGNLAPVEKHILWANYDEIMTELEEFHKDAFYQMTTEMRSELIAQKVKQIQSKLGQPFNVDVP